MRDPASHHGSLKRDIISLIVATMPHDISLIISVPAPTADGPSTGTSLFLLGPAQQKAAIISLTEAPSSGHLLYILHLDSVGTESLHTLPTQALLDALGSLDPYAHSPPATEGMDALKSLF